MPPATAEPPPRSRPEPAAAPQATVPPADTPEPASDAPARPAPAPVWKPALALLGSLLGLWLVLVILTGTTSLFLPGEEEDENPRIAPAVVVAPIEVGTLTRRRSFSGTLESPAVLAASPLVSGRVASVEVRLGDEVTRGQVLVELDPDELEQAAVAAEAQLAVAAANASEATAAEAIAERTVARVRQLREEGLTSDAEADTAEAQRLSAAAAVEVAQARLQSARADARTARIRRGYATVKAGFNGAEGATRRVAEVSVQQGDRVSPGGVLVRLVQLDPLRAVFTATQEDQTALRAPQPVDVTTDAYPGRVFPGTIDRLAPSFSVRSRQARVEVDVPNPDGLLRPGMFVRVTTALEEVDGAVSVPRDALVNRDGVTLVFVLPPGEGHVVETEVELGMSAGDRVQVLFPPIEGEVVVLGQQLLKDGVLVNPTPRMGEALVPLEVPEDAEDGGAGGAA